MFTILETEIIILSLNLSANAFSLVWSKILFGIELSTLSPYEPYPMSENGSNLSKPKMSEKYNLYQTNFWTVPN